MKSDLDKLMAQNNLDALLVTGMGTHNPAMVYLTGGGGFSHANLLKKQGQPPILFHYSMEREEAERTGIATRSFSQYPWEELMKESGGDQTLALALRYQKILSDFGLKSGRIALYGQMDLGEGYTLISEIQKLLPDVTFVGHREDDILQQAMTTKDHGEVERIRQVGRITIQIVQLTVEYLTKRKVKDGILLKENGQLLTIGDMRKKIDLWLAELGVESPEEFILSIGREAAIPHTRGSASDVFELGKTIIFDIYPCEKGGGYFYDFTRTWCLGYAPKEAQQLFDQVKTVYNEVVGNLEVGSSFSEAQIQVCEMYSKMGHSTPITHPETEEGYVHSLGHGVGLNIHERPFSGIHISPGDKLIPGAVFTIEPGLYYPAKGLGVRLEDTYYITPSGEFECLVDYPHDLVIEMK
jgi:Xaa-Pro aminopeptidase